MNMMSVTIREVKEGDKTILRNLFSLYLHDLSSYTTMLDIGEDGSFEYGGFDRFWQVGGISPYFIQWDDRIIGFILLLERPFLKKEHDYAVSDIFILNKYKGKGLGKKAIRTLFQEKKGKYYVIELMENKPAVIFWKKLYRELNIHFEERQEIIDDETCLVQTFQL